MNNLRGAKIIYQESKATQPSHLYFLQKDENYCDAIITSESGAKRKLNINVDLSNYYTKTEINTLINSIDLSNYYTKNEVNTNLSTKLDKGTYTGTAQDLKNSIDSKANISHTHDISSITNLQNSLDTITNDINNLEGINYVWSPTNRNLTLFDRGGNQLSQVSLVSLDNEGTDLRYNASTLSLELYNKDNELLDSIPVSSFVGSVGTQLHLSSNQLQLKDSQGNVLSTVSFTVSNIQGLQTALDSKEDISNKQNNLNADVTNTKYPTVTAVNSGLATKLDKGTYTGTAQSLKNEIDNKQNLLSSFDESILIETDGNIEGNVSLFEEYFEQQECELNFTPIQIVAVYQDGIKLSSSEYEIILPKKIKIKEYVDENIQIEYTHLKS